MVQRPVARILIALILSSGLMAPFTMGPSEAQSSSGQEALERYEAALQKRYEAAASQNAEEVSVLSRAADSALKEAAIAFLAEYESSKSPDDALKYVDVLKRQGNDDLAAEFIGGILEQGTKTPELLRAYGTALLHSSRNDVQEGIDALYDSLRLDDKSPAAIDTWNALGDYYLNEKMPDAARESFESALAINQEDVRAQLGMLVVEVFDGEIGSAGERLTQFIPKAQQYDTVLRAQLRLALADFDANRKHFSDTADNHYSYARLLYTAARYPRALQALQRAVQLAPDNHEMWNFLASFQGQLGDYPGAVKSLESSLRANPDQSSIKENLESLKKSLAQEAAERQRQQALPQGQGPLR